ncbi:MAG: hypothetical protein MHPDNHAH_03316 [Anaerolineales bacterium]|nr:hypothetical protein [Anaerolineales bacterium]WKZ48382.1 MAG: hypothetical protein QY306_03305 [Anaerolineales bacterium]
MNAKTIVIDGVTYNSVDEMPPEVRRNYEEAMRGFKEMNVENFTGAANEIKNIFADKNKDGSPDIFEGNQAVGVAGQMKFIVGGKTYNRLDELPPEARAKYEEAMASMDKNQNGMPDFLEGMLSSSYQPARPVISTSPDARSTTRHASRTPMPVTPTISPDTSNGWMLALGALFLLMVCALGALSVWYFFLR